MLDKLKELTKDTAVYGISTILGRFLTFALVPFYTNIFVPSDYGIITNYYAVIGILNIVFLYGMDSAFLKFASSKEIGDEKDNFSTPFVSIMITSVFLCIGLILFKEEIARFLGAPDTSNFVIYMTLILLFDSLAMIPFIKLRLQRRAKVFSLFKILNIVLNVALNLIFILVLKWGVVSVFIANLAASVFTLLLLFPSIYKNLRFSINKELLKRCLKFGIPYLPAGLGAMVIQVIDRPIMEHLTNLKTVGIYQANYKLGIFMMLFVNMFQFAWQPFFLQNAIEENAKEIFSKVLTYFTIAGSIILITLSLFISDLVQIKIFGRSIIGPAYWSGLNIVPVVLLGYMFNGIYIIFTAGIFIKEKSIYVPFIVGSAAILCIILNYALIPLMGIMGAAIATLAAYLAMALGFYFVTQRIYTIQYENWKLIKIFIIIFAVGTAFYILSYNNLLYFINKLILFASFFILLSIFVLEKSEINFIKRKLLRVNVK
ncbi:MAG TPA: oligosaccharide flippase family protein [Ignavibacteriaceae bacterium]|nr:oligosaccharide flippase family protein [Ignavibacteriaceae bacterium]